MIIEGITVTELMEKSGKSRKSVEVWISRHSIKPIVPEFLYPLDTLDKIKESKRGRPAKPNVPQIPADNLGKE